MIKIYPTTDSGLSHSTYSLKLYNNSIYPVRERPQRVRRTLSNNAIVSRWQQKREGATQTITEVLIQEDFETLESIAYHSTAFVWIVMSLDRNYKCTVSINQVTPVKRQNQLKFEVEIQFGLIEVLV